MQHAFNILFSGGAFFAACIFFYLWKQRQARIIRQYDAKQFPNEYTAAAFELHKHQRPAPALEASPQPLNTAHVARSRIVTSNECEFFQRLRHALPQYHICVQVAFSALLKPAKGISNSEHHSILGRFARKRADYVVCDPATMDVIAVIELDDRTHDSQKDKQRDELLIAAGYSVYRFASRAKPSVEELRALFTTQHPIAL